MRWLTIFLLVLLGGCASQRPKLITYDIATGKSIYASSKLLAGNISMSRGLASGHRVMMQAFASCDGRACKPSEVEIAFLNDSSADLNLDYRRIEIVFAGKSLQWEDHSRINEPTHYSVPRGEFIRVPVDRGDFEMIASAPEVELIFGLTGTTAMNVPFSRRESLRELAETIARQDR